MDTTSTPESIPTTAQELLSPDKIAQLRDKQADALFDKFNMLDGSTVRRGKTVDFRVHDIPEINKKYLDVVGLDKESPEYAKYAGLLNEFSIETTNPMGDMWNIPDENGKTLSEKYAERYNEVFGIAGAHTEVPEIARDPVTNESITEASDELKAVREKYAQLVAKRAKKSFERTGKAYELVQTREEVSDLIGAVATEMMVDMESRGLGEDQIKLEVEKFLGDQINDLVNEIESERAADFEDRSGFTKKFLNKWASWGDADGKIFSKEHFKGSFKKMGVFAVPGAAIGAALAVPLGIAGGGIVAGIGVGAAARSLFRSFAGAKLDKAAEAKTVAKTQAEQMHAETIDKIDSASHVELLKIVSERADVYRKDNRNRMIGGAAIALTAGLLSAKAVDVFEHTGLTGKVGEFISDKFTGGRTMPYGANHPLPGHPGSGGGNPIPIDNSGNHYDHMGGVGDDNGDISHGGGHHGHGGEISHGGHLSTSELFNGHGGHTEFTGKGLESFDKWVNGYKVKPGDSIWKLSEQYLNNQGVKHPSVFQIDAVKDHVLTQFQTKGIVGSNGWLNAGDTIRIK